MRRRAAKPVCFNCGEPAHASVKVQKPTRKIGKVEGAIYRYRPICMAQKCWEAFWNEKV